MSLDAAYALARTEPSDIVDHVPTLAGLVHKLDAQHVIELGVRSGVSTIAFLWALSATGGRLTSVDVNPAPHFDAPNWTFIQGDDLAVAVQLDRADIVFIDTSHYYLHTLAELERYVLLVNPGGRIVLHDTELERPAGAPPDDPPFPVRRAVAEFCTKHDLTWTNNPACNGLAEIMVGRPIWETEHCTECDRSFTEEEWDVRHSGSLGGDCHAECCSECR